mgnify:CR=1 FL=1
MSTFTAAKLNLWLGLLLIVGAGLMLLFIDDSSPAALFVIGVCNLVIATSAKKERKG